MLNLKKTTNDEHPKKVQAGETGRQSAGAAVWSGFPPASSTVSSNALSRAAGSWREAGQKPSFEAEKRL
jgi:hypothetical protein